MLNRGVRANRGMVHAMTTQESRAQKALTNLLMILLAVIAVAGTVRLLMAWF